MEAIPYALIVLGLFILLMIPYMIYTLIKQPYSVIRPPWRDQLSPVFVYAFGFFLILMALIGGVRAIVWGVRLLL